jgi:hypothetical protein
MDPMQMARAYLAWKPTQTYGRSWYQNGSPVSNREIDLDLTLLIRRDHHKVTKAVLAQVKAALRTLAPRYDLEAAHAAILQAWPRHPTTVKDALESPAVQAALRPFGAHVRSLLNSLRGRPLAGLSLQSLLRDGQTHYFAVGEPQ